MYVIINMKYKGKRINEQIQLMHEINKGLESH